jgi:hypothetical protein
VISAGVQWINYKIIEQPRNKVLYKYLRIGSLVR